MTRAIVKGFRKLTIEPCDPASFTRSSPAYNPEDGSQVAVNEPRYVTGEFGQALYVEEGTENIWAYSDPTIAQMPVKGNVADAGGVGDRFSNGIYFGDNSVARYAYREDALSPGTLYTLSCYILMDDGEAPVVGTNNSSGDFCFILQATISGSGNPVTVTAVGDDIYRVSVSFTSQSPIVSSRCGIAKYTGQSARGFKVSGFQNEAKGYATTLVPTSGAAATCSPEVTTIPTAGVLSPQEGTIEVWIKPTLPTSGHTHRQVIFEAQNAVASYFWLERRANGTVLFGVGDGSNVRSVISSTVLQPYAPYCISAGWSLDGIDLVVNDVDEGNLSFTPSISPRPTAGVGCAVGSSGYEFNGSISDLRISSKRRSVAERIAAYQSNAPLPVDEWTTYKAPFDGNLDAYGRGYITIPSNKTVVIGGPRLTRAVRLNKQ